MRKGFRFKILSRKQKEKLCIDTAIKLQRQFGNPIPNDLEDIIDFKSFSDYDLEKRILDDMSLINSIKKDKFIDFLINLGIWVFALFIIF